MFHVLLNNHHLPRLTAAYGARLRGPRSHVTTFLLRMAVKTAARRRLLPGRRQREDRASVSTRTRQYHSAAPLPSRQCAFNSSACRPLTPGQREPGGYAAPQNTRVGSFVLLWALCFIQALVIPIAVERAPEASRPPVSAKFNTDVAAASPLTAKAAARCQRASAVSNVWVNAFNSPFDSLLW
ncbi:hypothetical protein C8R45DRAFT_928705 [Mycena sanguinolenta]|nr:hypothetical protein C8R45DRAFT_928705 [Mycena sanguinolenta]